VGISTHILDTTQGKPAKGVTVLLERLDGSSWREVARGITNDDGRVKPLLDALPAAGGYRITFEVAPYFAGLKIDAFFPRVSIEFSVKATTEHYHVPLLLNPFGYSTYRGS
jgi:5-hydroxyisourate hydrolase